MNVSPNIHTKKLCSSALLLAIGIFLPQVFHVFGGSAVGAVFLPMHIPVFVSGLLLGPLYGAILGLTTPVLSFLISAMPSGAKLPFMMVELFVYGIASGFLRSKNVNIYISLLLSQIIGRAAYGLSLIFATYIFQVNISPIVTFLSSLTSGIPGIIIQIILIPPIVILAERTIKLERKHK